MYRTSLIWISIDFITYNRAVPLAQLWNAKAEKIQDIENHTKTTVLNQENNIFYPRFLYITARNSIHVQYVVNTCVKMKIHARIKN